MCNPAPLFFQREINPGGASAELIVLFAVAQEARSIDRRGKLEIYARQRARGGVCKQYPRSDAKQLNFHRSAAHSPSNLVFLPLSRAGARFPRSRFIFRVRWWEDGATIGRLKLHGERFHPTLSSGINLPGWFVGGRPFSAVYFANARVSMKRATRASRRDLIPYSARRSLERPAKMPEKRNGDSTRFNPLIGGGCTCINTLDWQTKKKKHE